MTFQISFQTLHSAVIAVAITLTGGVTAHAQEKSASKANSEQGQLVSDPATGIVYRKTIRMVEVPVTETKYINKQQQVFRPETVTETVPESKAVFVPETEYTWQPVLHNRWNPFAKPMITYQHVPQTQWKQKSDTVTRTQTRTKWIPENRMVSVPTQVVSIKRQEKVEYEPVYRSAPAQATPPNSINEAIAARMRPINPGLAANRGLATVPNTATRPTASIAALGRVQPPPFIDLSAIARGRIAPQTSGFVARPSTSTSPFSTAANNRTYNLNSNPASSAIAARNSAVTGPSQRPEVYGTAFGNTPYGVAGSRDQFNTNRIAASTVGRLTSDPPRRSINQGGMRSTDLRPSNQGYGQALAPVNQGTGIATLPGWGLFR